VLLSSMRAPTPPGWAPLGERNELAFETLVEPQPLRLTIPGHDAPWPRSANRIQNPIDSRAAARVGVSNGATCKVTPDAERFSNTTFRLVIRASMPVPIPAPRPP
jgi:hypothetical protein